MVGGAKGSVARSPFRSRLRASRDIVTSRSSHAYRSHGLEVRKSLRACADEWPSLHAAPGASRHLLSQRL